MILRLGCDRYVVDNFATDPVSDSPPRFTSGLMGFRKRPVPDRDALQSVRIIHGARDIALPVAGKTVGAVRERVRSLFNIAPDASGFLGIRRVGDGELIPQGAILEFLSLQGRKGVGKVWKDEVEICKAFGLTQERLRQWREKGLPLHEFDDGSILLTETDFDAWSVASLGLNANRPATEHHDDDLAFDAPYLSIKRAAMLTSLSQSHLRRAVHSGDLPASNVGSPAHPVWRIARKDVEGWLERKKGENPKLPPRSRMADLIKSHLPGL